MNISMCLLIFSCIIMMQRCTGRLNVGKGNLDRINNNIHRSNEKVKGIVGGRESVQEERAYQVMLRDPHQFCSGSIINLRYILTAAHCVIRKNFKNIQVVTGTSDGTKTYHSYRVSKVIIHRKYDEIDSFRNDIALLEVANPISFDSRVKRIRLPDSTTKVNDGDVVTVSGWGKSLGTRPVKLQEVDLKIVNQEYCKNQVRKRKYTLYNTQICAQNDDHHVKKAECNGDSGGPLVFKGILIGIVSWSIKDPNCGSKTYPGIFTRVSEYIDWIEKNTYPYNRSIKRKLRA